MSPRPFIRIAQLMVPIFVMMALFPAPVRASEDGEKLDAVHHQADAYYLDFAPFSKLELPRIFVVRRADGSLGLDVFRSTTQALAHGYVASFDAGHAEAAGDGADGASHDPDAAAETGAASHDADPTPSEDPEVHGVTSETSPADSAMVGDAHDEPVVEGEAVEGEAAGTHAEEAVAGHESVLDAHILPAEGELIVDLSISKHLVFAWIAAFILLLVLISVARRYKAGVGRDSAPKGLLQNLVETLVMFVRDDIVRPSLGDKTERYLPYLLTAFFFILVCNLLGLVPFAATATSNIMVTAVLATFTFVITQIGGSRDYWAHIFWPPGVPTFVKPILIPVEILGIFTKPFALAIRLFANMTAGHLVILSLIGLIFAFTDMMGTGVGLGVSPVAVAFALFIYVLELLVAFIQAYVFTMLSALFIGMAVAEHEHHDEAHGHPAHPHELPAASGDGIGIAETGMRSAVPQTA